MAHAVRMPKPGQMTEECVLSLWLKAEGDPIAKGDVLFEIESDKATMEVESFHDGVFLRRLVDAGETVPVNTICAWVGEPGEPIPEDDDAEAPLETPVAPLEAPALRAPEPAPGRHAADAATGITISPRARTRALAAGLDVRRIRGSGPGGRIVERDIDAALASGSAAPATPAPGPGPLPPVDGEEEPRPLSRMRRVIAERLTLSATTMPTFTATVAADVTRLLALRDELRAGEIHLTVTDFVLAATAQALADYPDVNARTDGSSVWPRSRVHLGMAVALRAGLVVAVIRDADRLDLLELHDEAARLVAAARAGTLPADDMTGSTFTVSNLGMHGVQSFTAIINPGESGILAVAAAVPTPVVVGGGIAIRTLMNLTLTADHRIVDGELGARFLGGVRRRLEDPAGLRDQLHGR